MTTKMEEEQKWKRNLYEKTGLPDNYTPNGSFLAAIERNKHLSQYNILQCCSNAAFINLQLCSVFLFNIIYINLQERSITPNTLLTILLVAVACGFVILSGLTPRNLRRNLKSLSIFWAFGLFAAPILHKLTASISTDTIHTMSNVAFVIHLLTHDYHDKTKAYAANALSTNATVFSAVCLASRLETSWHGFVLVTTSVACFVMFPVLRRRVNKRFSLPLALISSLATLTLSITVSGYLTIGILGALLSVTIVAPVLFVRWQCYKDTIHGPWDEAVPSIQRQ